MDTNNSLKSGTAKDKIGAISKPANIQSQASALLCDPPDRANHTTDGGNCGDRGAQPSNTAPANCKNHQTLTRSDQHGTSVLHTGIDSLYVSYHGTLSPEIEKKLELCKEYAQSTEPDIQSKAVIYLVDHCFMVKPTGKGKFAYVIVDNWFHIQIARSTTKLIPMVYVQISSELLTRTGIKPTLIALNNILSTIGERSGPASVSRVDLCADFVTDFNISTIPRESWVTRSNKFNAYYENKKLTGFVFGEGSPISCRLYNKTVEIHKSKKTYFNPIWKENGWDEESEIWRLEFQFKREVLRELQIHTADDLLKKLSLLWEYSTKDWLKLTLPSPTDTTQSRWPLHPLWLQLIKAKYDGDRGEALTRIRKERLPSDEYLYINGISAITSIMARDGLADFDEAMEIYRKDAHEYHRNRSQKINETLNKYARDKAAQKARRYNTLHKDQYRKE